MLGTVYVKVATETFALVIAIVLANELVIFRFYIKSFENFKKQKFL